MLFWTNGGTGGGGMRCTDDALDAAALDEQDAALPAAVLAPFSSRSSLFSRATKRAVEAMFCASTVWDNVCTEFRNSAVQDRSSAVQLLWSTLIFFNLSMIAAPSMTAQQAAGGSGGTRAGGAAAEADADDV
jgi:hypothetical protein